jgi:hypothetical protein
MKLLIAPTGDVTLVPAGVSITAGPEETLRDATVEEIALIEQGGYLRIVDGVLTEVPVPPPDEVPLWRLKQVAEGVPYGDGDGDGNGNLLQAIDAAVASTPAKWVWANGNTIARNSALLDQLAEGLNLTSEQVDEFFRQAAAITV